MDSGANKRARFKYGAMSHKVLFKFAGSMQYGPSEKPETIAVDYLAGTTDNFAMRSFFELYPTRR
jgi:hypothetical protein